MDGELQCLNQAGLQLDEPLVVKFKRSEEKRFVCREYEVDKERQADVFNVFIRVRHLHQESHKQAHAAAPTASTLRAVQTLETRDLVRKVDVHRACALLCAGPVVANQVEVFMRRFDPHGSGSVTRQAFERVLADECGTLKLNLCEQVFFHLDEPSSSAASLRVAIAIMLLILVSSVGFVVATEERYQVPSNDPAEPPKEIAGLVILEAACIYVFTVEYLTRGLTVWAVRDFLRSPTVHFTVIDNRNNTASAAANTRTTNSNSHRKQRAAAAAAAEARGEKGGGGEHRSLFSNRSAATVVPIGAPEATAPLAPAPSPTPPLAAGAEKEGAKEEEKKPPAFSKRLSPSLDSWKAAGPSPRPSPLGVVAQLSAVTPHASDGPLQRTWRYLTTVMNLIDALAILPFYLEDGGGGLGVLRILRLARVFRLFKAPALSEGVTLLGNVIRQSYPSLRLLTFFALIGCILYGSIIHLCEQGTWHGPDSSSDDDGSGVGVWMRPDTYGTGLERTPFLSIPRSMWWVMVTATTCGYGDMYPTTDAGKVVASLTMLSGVLVLALPITIISSNFTQEFEKLEDAKDRAKLDKQNLDMNTTMSLTQGALPTPSSLGWNQSEKKKTAQEPAQEPATSNTAASSETTSLESDSSADNSVVRAYRGTLVVRLERHLEMLFRGARVVSLLDALVHKGCVSEAASVAITREVLGLMHRASSTSSVAGNNAQSYSGGGGKKAALSTADGGDDGNGGGGDEGGEGGRGIAAVEWIYFPLCGGRRKARKEVAAAAAAAAAPAYLVGGGGQLTGSPSAFSSADVDNAVQIVLLWFRRMFVPPEETDETSTQEDDVETVVETVVGGSATPPSIPSSAPCVSRKTQQPGGGGGQNNNGGSHLKVGEGGEIEQRRLASLLDLHSGLRRRPSEDEEHELRHRFLSFVIKVIPPVSTAPAPPSDSRRGSSPGSTGVRPSVALRRATSRRTFR